MTDRIASAKWLGQLDRHARTSGLRAFLSAMEEVAHHGEREGSIQQAASSYQTFIKLLAAPNQQFPCGLRTSTLPRYIALVNQAGKRQMFSSSFGHMMRLLCCRSPFLNTQAIQSHLDVFEAFLERPVVSDVHRCVIITCWLPALQPLSALFWSINSCEIHVQRPSERKVYDRELSFSSMSIGAFEASPTINQHAANAKIKMGNEQSMEYVSSKTQRVFESSYCVIDTDHVSNDRIVSNLHGCEEARATRRNMGDVQDAHDSIKAITAEDRMRDIIAHLKNERVSLSKENRQLRDAEQTQRVAFEAEKAHLLVCTIEPNTKRLFTRLVREG